MCSSQRSQAFELATTTERLQVGRGYTRLTLHPPSWSHVPRRTCTVIALENSSILKPSLWVVHVSVVVALKICYTNGVVHTRNLLTMASCLPWHHARHACQDLAVSWCSFYRGENPCKLTIHAGWNKQHLNLTLSLAIGRLVSIQTNWSC